MKCKRAMEMISEYLDGLLDPDERESFDLHIRDCTGCRKVLQEDLAVHDLFVSAERFPAPQGFVTRVMANLGEKEASRPWSFPASHPFYLRTVQAALALIVLFVGLISGGSLVSRGPVAQGKAGIHQSFSLDVFEPAPVDSIAGVYIAMAGRRE